MITQKQRDQIEYKCKETLRINLSKITYKYKNLKETNDYLLEKKQEREISRAYNKAELRKKNQLRKAEGKKVKEKPINRVKKCDELRSKYIRSKYTECYTCGGKQSLGCGHYITRKIRAIRRDERNTKVQDFRKCNAKFSWNWMPIEFEKRLREEWVDTEELKRIALAPNPKPSETELKAIYESIKLKISLQNNNSSL